MKASYQNRIDKLDRQLPSVEDDDEIIIIRLSWDDPIPPIVCRRGKDGKLIRKVGLDTIPAHLRGEPVNITTTWDEIEIIE
mgnify:CR=1 FL=1